MSIDFLPLTIFTVLTQIGIGLAVLAAVRQWQTADGPQVRPVTEWVAVAGLLLAGVVAAFFHLGQPLSVWRIVLNVGSSWLSREIVLFIVLIGLVGGAVWLARSGPVNGWLLKAIAGVGVLALAAMGMTYAPAGQPAIHNIWPFVFFVLTALTAGSAVARYFAPDSKQGLVTWVFASASLIGLVLYLSLPCAWLSGNAVVAATGHAFLSSPVYWAYIVIGLALPLGVVGVFRRIPVWLPPFVHIGEFLGRVAFFTLMAHNGLFIGNPF